MFYVSLVILSVLFFSWWFKRNKKVIVKDTSNKNILHKHDLAQWNYLGFSRYTYNNKEGDIISEHTVFFFVDKKDQKKRSYTIVNDRIHANEPHPYISKFLKPWASGEWNSYDLIRNEGSFPSDYLRKLMINKKYTWDNTAYWWKKIEDEN